MSCAETAEPIILLFRLWTRVGRRKHKFNCISQVAPMYPTTLCHQLCKNGCTDRFAVWVVDSGGPKKAHVQSYSLGGANVHNLYRIRQVAPMCPHGRAHWRHLANTTELSICGGDVVLCQITLTTCLNLLLETRQALHQGKTAGAVIGKVIFTATKLHVSY